MKLRNALLPLALVLSLPALAHADAVKVKRGFTIQDMAYLDRFSSPTLSPDADQIVFAKRVVDKETNKASSALWIRDLGKRHIGAARQLTPDGWNVNSPSFSDDGDRVFFLSAQGGSMQLYRVDADGGEPVQLTAFPLDVDGYVLSPNGGQVALAFSVFADCKADLACTKQKLDAEAARKSTGVIYEQLFIRHWDTWMDGRLNRVFAAKLGGKDKLTSATLLSGAIHGDIPSKPFGDLSDFAWSADGQQVAMSVRQSNREEPWSTNFDIWLVNADGSGAQNLTEANKAWDAGPVFSADGKTLYYRAMQRPGFEADRYALMAMNLADHRVREIAPNWDRSANGIALSDDGKTIFTTTADLGEGPLFAVSIKDGKVKKLAGDGSISSVGVAGDTLAFARASFNSGAQLFVIDADGRHQRAVSPSAGDMLPDVAWGTHQQFSFKGWNDETVYGYVIKPWNYVEGKKYPVAFLIHGGPQGSFGNGWSYRWNPQTYTGQGYAVVMIDFHGSVGYGQAFTDAISQHWGDRPFEDLQKGWAAAQQQFVFLDGSKACALGASYGGYMINWIEGNWYDADGNAPFKCLVSHDGVFENHAMGYATEELWFSEWENGGTPYENLAGYQKFNPANHVASFKVPMLVIHGQKDYRIPVEQGIALFTALQRKGVESKFLYFPDENHWVLKPQNSVLWHDTVNAWLKKFIGTP